MGQAALIDVPGSAFALSSGFEAAFAMESSADGGAGAGSYAFYAVNGIQLTPVGHEPVDQLGRHVDPAYRSAGPKLVRTDGKLMLIDTVGATNVAEQAVPGDYQTSPGSVIDFSIDPVGRWLYIGTAEVDAQSHPIEATTQHWVSRLQAGGPLAAQLIGQGYAIDTVRFSPDGRRLVLHGYDSYPQKNVPVAFRLFDLTDPTKTQAYELDIPCNWAESTWSPDSTYVSFIGGAPETHSRPLLVVDALAPNAAPRLIVECDSNPAPLPGCPNIATFQP
jgi:hypothetical protein